MPTGGRAGRTGSHVPISLAAHLENGEGAFYGHVSSPGPLYTSMQTATQTPDPGREAEGTGRAKADSREAVVWDKSAALYTLGPLLTFTRALGAFATPIAEAPAPYAWAPTGSPASCPRLSRDEAEALFPR